MEHQRKAWLIVVGVLLIGLGGLFPMWRTEAATIAVSGNLRVSPFRDDHEISHDGKWFVFKALHSDVNGQYDIYLLDLTVTPYAPIRLDIPPLNQENSNDAGLNRLQFSSDDRYLLVNRKASSTIWELYLYDFATEVVHFLGVWSSNPNAQFLPDGRLLIHPGGTVDLYNVPLLGGEGILLTPPEFYNKSYAFDALVTPDGSHVLMSASPRTTYTHAGLIGYAPLTGTGITLWQQPGELPEPAPSIVFSSDGNYAYFKTFSYLTSNYKLYRLALIDGTVVPLIEASDISLRQVSRYYGIVRYSQDNGTKLVYRLALDNGNLDLISETSHQFHNQFAYHEKSRQFLFGTIEDDELTVYSAGYDPITTPIPLLTISVRNWFDLTLFEFNTDGTTVFVGEYLETSEYLLYSVATDGNTPPIPLLNGVPSNYRPKLATTGNALWAATLSGGKNRIVYLPLNGDPPRTTFVSDYPNTLSVQRVLGENQLIFLYRETEGTTRSYFMTDLRPAARLTMERTILQEGLPTELKISLIPSPTTAITFTLELSGEVSHQDLLFESEVVIPPDTTTFSVPLFPVADKQSETPEVGNLRLIPTGNVVVESPDEVEFTIYDSLQRIYLPLIRYFD